MMTNIHYGNTCEVSRRLMKHLADASEGPRKKSGKLLLAEAMERTRFQLKVETPLHREEYWKYHPEDLASALVELLVEGSKKIGKKEDEV